MATKQTVTMGASVVLSDSSVYIAGKGLYLLTNTNPAKLYQFTNLDDLSAQNSFTFASDGHHAGAAQPNLTYDTSGGFLYASFTYEDGSLDEHCLIVKIDPNSISTQTDPFVDFVLGTNGTPQGAVSIVNDGTSLWCLTKPTLENAWLARVNIATPSTRTTQQISGSNHIRGHALAYDAATSRIYFAGTKVAAPKLAWTGWAELDLSAHSTINVSTTKGFGDDITIIGSNYFLNYENEDTPSGSVCKVAKDLSATTDYSTGVAADIDGQYYDGTGLWVTTSNTNPAVLKQIDPSTGTVLQSVSLDTGETQTNEINPYLDSTALIVTTSQNPSKAIRQPLTAAPSTPIARRTLYF